jgi:hypothetical protein
MRESKFGRMHKVVGSPSAQAKHFKHIRWREKQMASERRKEIKRRRKRREKRLKARIREARSRKKRR